MENHALDIIDMLYTMIAESWGVPIGNDRCIIERGKVLGMLDDLKAQLPMELAEARRLMVAREEFVENTKNEVAEMKQKAEEEAKGLLERESVYQRAQEESEKLMKDTETKTKELRRNASTYLDDALRETEEAVAKTLDDIRQARARFRAASAPEVDGTAEVTMRDIEDDNAFGDMVL